MSSIESRRVAVIGAGISGVCTATHRLKAGVDVTLLERCDTAGGVWHYDDRLAQEPGYPNTVPSKGDYTRYEVNQNEYMTPPRTPDSTTKRSKYQDIKIRSHDDFDTDTDIRISHAPPGPCYVSLKNNVPLTLMETSLLPWPSGLEQHVSQKYLEQYIQDISRISGAENITEYNTRVEKVIKSGEIWKVTTATLTAGPNGHSQVVLQTRDFDAVVVASGHYHMPRIPDIPGLKEWKKEYPTRIQHSKTYRSYKGPANHRVLLIGTGNSSCDIAKDLGVMNIETYQSSRGGALELPSTFLPDTALRIGPVKSFTTNPHAPNEDTIADDDAIPGHIDLQNGSKLCNIHHIILATGYITSFPFLSQYHNDDLPRTLAGNDLLVTSEGDMVHNLHKDIFYIEDPTLAFIGIPYHIATFSLFDYQAQIVARVFSGQLKIPNKPELRREYEDRVQGKGLGRDFHSLRDVGEEVAYVRDLVDWANGEASVGENVPMTGHSDEWLQAYEENKAKINFLVGTRRADVDACKYDDVALPDTVTCL